MPISDALLPEFDHEMATTRTVLSRVAEDRFDYQPHPKSWSMKKLAMHCATIPQWVADVLQKDSFDVSVTPVDYQPPVVTSQKELLALFDQNVGTARAAIANATDEQLFQPWSLLKEGKAIFTQPKAGVLRGFVMNHGIHHRGQLSVYLRLNDIPVPSIYGPSADEGAF